MLELELEDIMQRRVRFDYDPEPDLSWLLPEEQDNHIVLYAVREEQCPHCNSWKAVDSLYGISFNIGDQFNLGTFDDLSLHQIVNNYQRTIAKNMLSKV